MRGCTNGQCSDTTVQIQYETGKDDCYTNSQCQKHVSMKLYTASQYQKQVRIKCYTNGRCSDAAVQNYYETGKDEMFQ